jgi:AAHS family 4-hydroxybenzoate transporter-like MFS transporter
MAAQSEVVNVSALIDRRVGPYQLWIFVICALMALIDGFDSQVIGISAPMMAGELHLSPGMLGPIFSAGQWGSLVGAFLFGPCADRWGRWRFLVGCSLVLAIATLLTAWATSFETVLLCRVLTGLGIGGSGPCFVALASEYAPRRIRAGMVTIVWGAVPGGGLIAALLGATLIGDFGWRSIYYLGGGFGVLVTLLVIAQLPESLGFMVARGADPAKIRRVLARMALGAVAASATRFSITEETKAGVPVKHLFTEGRGIVTILLWIAFFAGFGVLIATLVWLPGLLKVTGMTVAGASMALAFNNVGGVIGTIGVGQLIDRFGSYSLLALIYLGGAVVTVLVGFTAPDFWFVAILSGFCGLLMGGGGSGLIALAALTYPTFMRSTGIGWALGFSRFGSATVPLVVGLMFAARWSVSGIFLALGSAVLIDVLVVGVMGVLARNRRLNPPVTVEPRLAG